MICIAKGLHCVPGDNLTWIKEHTKGRINYFKVLEDYKPKEAESVELLRFIDRFISRNNKVIDIGLCHINSHTVDRYLSSLYNSPLRISNLRNARGGTKVCYINCGWLTIMKFTVKATPKSMSKKEKKEIAITFLKETINVFEKDSNIYNFYKTVIERLKNA